MNIWQIDCEIERILDMVEDGVVDPKTGEIVDPETGEVISVENALCALNMAREEKIENAALAVKNMTAEANAIKREEEILYERRKAIEKKRDKFKNYLIEALTREDGTTDKIKTARASVSVKINPPSTVITDMDALPKEFLREKTEVAPDKVSIKEVLLRGINVPGARLEQTRSVMIK